MDVHDTAWLAGLFEGEGTITFVSRSSVRVAIGMTDEDVIATVYRLFPRNTTYRREVKNRIKPLYVWRLEDRENVREFLTAILPYLHSRRRERALAALKRLEANRGLKSERTHCPRGHPLSGDNLYIQATNGARSCRACRDRRDRERPPKRVPPSECVCEHCGKTFLARRGTRWCSQRCRHHSWRDRRRAQGLPV